MGRFALIVAACLGFAVTAALCNMLVPARRAFAENEARREAAPSGGEPVPESDASGDMVRSPLIRVLCSLCLMLGVMAAAGMGWFAACAASIELIAGSGLTSRLLAALGGSLAFGAVGLADDIYRLRSKSPLGLRRPARLCAEAFAAAVALAPVRSGGWLSGGVWLPSGGFIPLGGAQYILWALCLIALAEAARVSDGADGTVCGSAFVVMLGLMFAMTAQGNFPLAVLPAASAGALTALLLWNFPPAKLPLGAGGCLFSAAAVLCVPLCLGSPEIGLPLALPFWLEGGTVALQVIFYRLSRGKRLFERAPFHAWLAAKGVSPAAIFYIMCAIAAAGAAGVVICL